MSRNHFLPTSHLRERIIQLAARLMAEDGIDDFGFAKRKAARQLGVGDIQNLPSNSEIEQALRDYQALFQRDEQAHRLRELRLQAARVMHELVAFDPYLTGPVLTGTAARYCAIDIMLFPDNPKDVDLFWLNRNLVGKISERQYRFLDRLLAIPVKTVNWHGNAEVNIAIFSTADMKRMPLRSLDGQEIQKGRLSDIEILLDIKM